MTQPRFREATFFCDFNHPAVSSLAKRLASDETDHGKITAAVFRHVRDDVRFGIDSVRVKASETLTKGYGACYNKALLMMALLRSNDIPARLACRPVKREFIRPAMGDACASIQEPFHHCFVQVRLDDTWVSIDATLDARTYRKLFAPRGVAWGIDWNGKDDMLLYADHIAGPAEYFEDVDSAIERDVGNVMPPPSDADAMFGPINRQMWQAVDN